MNMFKVTYIINIGTGNKKETTGNNYNFFRLALCRTMFYNGNLLRDRNKNKTHTPCKYEIRQFFQNGIYMYFYNTLQTDI